MKKRFNVKRILITGIIVFVCYILQTCLFPHLTFAGIKPNLLVILVSAYGFMRGKRTGMLVGFFAGFLLDSTFGTVAGFHMIFYTLLGYINGVFSRIFFDDDIKLPILLISLSDLAYGLVFYFIAFMLVGDFRFSYYLLRIILPETVYTMVMAIILYPIILYISHRLASAEQRSASRFV